jgi:hypothetical protein
VEAYSPKDDKHTSRDNDDLQDCDRRILLWPVYRYNFTRFNGYNHHLRNGSSKAPVTKNRKVVNQFQPELVVREGLFDAFGVGASQNLSLD